MTPDEYTARYRCGYCDKTFVVPTLARQHEARHEALNELAADITADTPPDRIIRTR